MNIWREKLLFLQRVGSWLTKEDQKDEEGQKDQIALKSTIWHLDSAQLALLQRRDNRESPHPTMVLQRSATKVETKLRHIVNKWFRIGWVVSPVLCWWSNLSSVSRNRFDPLLEDKIFAAILRNHEIFFYPLKKDQIWSTVTILCVPISGVNRHCFPIVTAKIKIGW